MLYTTLYVLMLVGFLGCSLYTPGLKMRIIGILCLLINALLFYRR